jgi:YD repeat-containing protein
MSMVSGPFWRSLPRAILTDTFQPIVAFRLYLNNQCWFYPEHRDYDPGTGDLYPANTPYYVISQGSSFSDKPFIEAFAAAMAAFQPAVKRELAARKWLAPTLQMIFRATQRSVKSPEDYLTGAAHPAVFDAGDLDVEAMVRLAHALKADEIPPPVALRTLKDAQPEPGVEYFDARPEILFDTPFAIARVVRGVALKRSMTVEASAPVKPGAAQYRWVVLQGDPAKIDIKPLTPDASRVELTVAYHGVYRPQGRDGLPSPVQSSRVDIGCFVKTGERWSAPSFVSFHYLPNEARVYRDDGRILSVDYANAAHRYADPVLTLAKGWKDLYEYDAQGRLLGWYRTRGGGQPERFTWRGHKVLATDAKNRPVKACAVQYLPRQAGVEGVPPSLSCVDAPELFTHTYADDDDKVGKASPVQ